jgi:hypothetical protein
MKRASLSFERRRGTYCLLADHGVTVKVPELVVVPPVVVMAIFPVIAPLGTVAVT